MDLFLAICQGLGLSLAIGIGGALAALFASMMASLAAGFDPEGTDFGFIASTWFLVTLLAFVVLALLARGRESLRIPVIALLSAAGGLAFAASLTEEGSTGWPGLVVGIIATAVAAMIATDVLEGAINRAKASGTEAGESAANTLIVGFSFGGMALAALALFVPPVSLIAAAALLFLAIGRRRKAGEKYEGLRILR
jgi:hypothetical protein